LRSRPRRKKARETLKIPIIGAGSTSALITKSMGLPVGIIGVFAEPLIAVEEVLGSLLVESIRPDKVITALDFSNTEVIESIKNAGISLKEKGARCILLTCTAMSLIGIAPYLNEQLVIPVIDPLIKRGSPSVRAGMRAISSSLLCIHERLLDK